MNFWHKKSICILLVFVLLTPGCQLHLANYFRDKVFPQDTTAKVALAPLLFPSYAVLSVTDVIIINPILGAKNIPETTSSIWGWGNKNAWVGYVALMPVKIVAIPLGAIGTMMFSEQFLYSGSKESK